MSNESKKEQVTTTENIGALGGSPLPPPEEVPVGKPPEQNVQETTRKRTIQQRMATQLQARKLPDIGAGVCDYCGHPPYRCPKCNRKLHQIGPDKNGHYEWNKTCSGQDCRAAIPPEAYDPLAYCSHYRDIKDDIVCIYCKDKEATQSRRIQVRGVPQLDGSEVLVTVCADVRCRQAFTKEHAGKDYPLA